MTLTCLSIILTKSLGAVFPTMRLGVPFHSIMTKHVGGISVVRRQQLKFFSVVFIDLLYFEMLLSIARVSLDASG